MELSVKLKERFCRDANIPIRLFREPYFSDRLKLYDPFYGTQEKWDRFVKEVQKYECEQDYFEEYNRVKDAAITDIKNSKGYQRFCEADMTAFQIKNTGLPAKDIYRTGNDGNRYIGIDMRKANFSSLYYYDPGIFGGADSWEAFIARYTQNRHIVDSKYIREVIFGNCNPRRHISYEKFLVDQFLTKCMEEEKLFTADRVKLFSNDEIMVDVTDLDEDACGILLQQIQNLTGTALIPLKAETFILRKAEGMDGYYKEVTGPDGKTEIVFKCLDHYMLPFVMRKLLGQEIKESDTVFYHEGRLAKFIEWQGRSCEASAGKKREHLMLSLAE